MPWHIAPWADEIGGDQPLAQRICNEPIVLFREGTSRAGALADRCCHRAAPHVIPTGHPHEISKGQPIGFAEIIDQAIPSLSCALTIGRATDI